MKKKMSFTLTLLLVSLLFLQNAFTEFGLPEGAKTRFGKGYQTGSRIFSDDGTRFAVASSIGLWIYDVFTAQEVALLTNHPSEFTVLAVSPDDNILASADENTISLWEIHTGRRIAQLTEHSEDITTLVFSPDGKVLASASEDNTVRLWEATTGRLLFLPLSGHAGDITSLAFSPDSKILASGSRDNAIRLWSVTTGQHLATLEEQIAWGVVTHEGHTGDVTAVAFSPDGATLASGGTDNKIRLWNVGTKEHRTAISAHSERVTALAYSPDGTILASGSTDDTIRLWNPTTRRRLDTLKEYERDIITLAFSVDGTTLVSGHTGSLSQSWDGRTGEHLSVHVLGYAGYGSSVRTVTFSPHGIMLASGQGYTGSGRYTDQTGGSCPGLFWYRGKTYTSYSGSVSLWNTLTNERNSTLKSDAYSSLTNYPGTQISWDRGFVHALAFSPDNTILASAETKSLLYEDYCSYLDYLEYRYLLRFWSADTGDHLFTREGHNGPITSVAFSTDNKLLASGSRDDTIRLWNPTTGQHLTTFRGHSGDVNSVALSSDGETLASGSSDDTIKLWNSNGQVRATLYGHGDAVRTVAFSPDGKILASGSDDDTIRLWNPTTAKHIMTLEGHTSWVRSVVFSPDGGTLASASYDRTIRLWDSATGQHIATS